MTSTYTDEELERCTLTAPREIVFLLRSLVKRADRVSVIFDDGRQSFLTLLLDVSDQEGMLHFDIGGSPEINTAFLKADHCTFQTFVDGVRIQFTAGRCRELVSRGERVFATPIPKSVLRLQRRDVFRIPLPVVKPYTCRIRRQSNPDETLPLHDISLGGVGFLLPKPPPYQTQELLEDCLIDLHEFGTLAVCLEVRHLREIESRTGKPLWHLGCMFINPSSASEMLIQRFMARIEVDRRALSAE